MIYHLYFLLSPFPQKYCLPRHQEQRNQQSYKIFIKHLNKNVMIFIAPPFHTLCQYSIIIPMKIFDKIERAISQRHEQAFDNLGKSIEAMAASFDTFDFETLSSRISKKMMVHLDAIGNYFMEGGNQDEILDKLGKKIEEKQESVFDPVLEYFNKPAYEIDQNLFGKVVKFQEDKTHQRGHIEVVGKTSLRGRSSSAESCNSKRKPRLPSSQGTIQRKRSLVKSIKRNRSSSRGSSNCIQQPKKMLCHKNSQRSSSRKRPSSQGSESSMKKPKQASLKNSQRSGNVKRKRSLVKSIRKNRSSSQESESSIKKPKQASLKNSQRSHSRSIKSASPRNSEQEVKYSGKSEQQSQNSVEIKKEISRQEIKQTEPISFPQHQAENNALSQQYHQESPQRQSNIDVNKQQIEEQEQPASKSDVQIIEQRVERLETRFNRAQKLKAQTTKLFPLTQKAQVKALEEDEDNNQASHQTKKIEVKTSSQASINTKEEVSSADNAQTVKKHSSPEKQQGSAERPLKRQKTPPRMPYNIDVQYPRSIEKTKKLTPKKH